MSTEEELKEARERLFEASEEKQREHFRKIYEEAVNDPVLSEHETLLEQDGHLLPNSDLSSAPPPVPPPEPPPVPPPEPSSAPPVPPPEPSSAPPVLSVSGDDFLFPQSGFAGNKIKSKKKRYKKKRSKKKRSKKKRSKKKRSKRRRSRKYIQKGGDSLQIWMGGGWQSHNITYNGDGSITVDGKKIKCGKYYEWFGGCWAFEQPDGKIVYIKPSNPSNMTDLLTNWGC